MNSVASLNKLIFMIFFKKRICLALFYVHWCEGVRFPGTGVTDSYEMPCGCWELNPGSFGRAASALNQ